MPVLSEQINVKAENVRKSGTSGVFEVKVNRAHANKNKVKGFLE